MCSGCGGGGDSSRQSNKKVQYTNTNTYKQSARLFAPTQTHSARTGSFICSLGQQTKHSAPTTALLALLLQCSGIVCASAFLLVSAAAIRPTTHTHTHRTGQGKRTNFRVWQQKQSNSTVFRECIAAAAQRRQTLAVRGEEQEALLLLLFLVRL